MSTKINNKIDTETFQLLIYSIFAPIDNVQKNSWNCVSNLTKLRRNWCGEFTIPPPIEIPSLWCRILKSNILVSVMGKP